MNILKINVNKEQKQIIKYIFYVILSITIPIIYFWVSTFFIMKSCNPGVYMCGFLQLALLMICVKWLQVCALIYVTAFTIRNTTSKYLYQFFNSGNEYIYLLMLFLYIKITLKYFEKNDYIFPSINSFLYNMHDIFGVGISILSCYLCIFFVIVINRINKILKNRQVAKKSKES